MRRGDKGSIPIPVALDNSSPLSLPFSSSASVPATSFLMTAEAEEGREGGEVGISSRRRRSSDGRKREDNIR